MKYAKIDSTSPSPHSVVGWYDDDSRSYPGLDFTQPEFVKVTASQWAQHISTPGELYYYPASRQFTQTPPPPTLIDIANAQISTLQASFASAAIAPVTDSNGVQWNGGEHSASSIDGAVRLAQNTSASTVDLWDYANTKHNLSISAGQAVVDAVAGAYQSAFQKWQGLRAQVVALQKMQPRANGTKYSSGVQCTDGNGGLWKCTTAGTSGSKKPSWPKSPTTSSTVTDGGVTWAYVSTLEAAIQAVAW